MSNKKYRVVQTAESKYEVQEYKFMGTDRERASHTTIGQKSMKLKE